MASSTEYYYMRKSGQIPAFGDWEKTNELPITQYFECARQAGLSSCNRECCSNYGAAAASSAYVNSYYSYSNSNDMYGFGFYEYEKKPANAVHRSAYAVPQRKVRTGLDKSSSHMREQRKEIKVRDLMDHHQPRNKNHHHQTLSQKHYKKKNNTVVVKSDDIITSQQQQKFNAKPVDEDLYKIPSEHIENPKRKKMLGFFYRCMAPPCAA